MDESNSVTGVTNVGSVNSVSGVTGVTNVGSEATHSERCKKLANTVQFLSQTELEEMFKMIHENNCEYSKNNNGIFVNLAWIPLKLLEQLEQYVLFCNKSGTELKKYESLCDVLNKKLQTDKHTTAHGTHGSASAVARKNHSHATVNRKDVAIENVEQEDSEVYEKTLNKISSSMKFTLLKKKLAKVNTQNIINENELKTEDYIL